MRLIVFLVGVFLSLSLQGQTDTTATTNIFSNWRFKTIAANEAGTSLDSLTILPSSLQIFCVETREEVTNYKIISNKIYFNKKPKCDSLDIRYRVMPYNLSFIQKHKDTTWIAKKHESDYIGYEYNPYGKNQKIFQAEGLDYTGSFARGISVGNSQDLVLNSSFNLQLSGTLGDDVEVLAAISDNNIPLQPEGNTQQLNEFDRIFIQLKRKNTTLIAGDYEIKRPAGYFLNYYKRLQGASVYHEMELDKKTQLNARGSVALSRGKFGRNTLNVQEGNQGPYKLVGNEGERFIIILAGTEKVFVNGVQAVRGQEQDYIIDYNRGEITFMPRLVVNNERRFVVEFEYSEQNYLRSLYATNLNIKREKLDVYFNLFSEQDGKNASNQLELSAANKRSLAALGDNTTNNFVSGIDVADEISQGNQTTYHLIDTLGFDSVLVLSYNNELNLYTARFSDVGQGNGDYVRVDTARNGIAFAWVAPDSLGNHRGRYQPVIRLTAPQLKQMYTLGAQYDLTKNSKVMAEVAMSHNDLNRFSELDAEDDWGGALRTGYEHKWTLNQDKKQKTTLTATADYEFTQEDFRAINPFRSREFSRDWNIDNQRVDQHLATAGLNLKRNNIGNIQYKISTFLRDSIYQGVKHFAGLGVNKNGFKLNIKTNYLKAESLTERSQFFRPNMDISQTFNKLDNWTLGMYAEREQNRRMHIDSSTLFSSSFYFDDVKFYIKNTSYKNLKIEAYYKNRRDYAPSNTDFFQSMLAEEYSFNGFWKVKSTSNLNWNFNYRNVTVMDSTLALFKPQKTYLGRAEYFLNIKKGLVRSNTLYELGSGQEPKLEFVFQETEAGLGQYKYLGDINEDGEAQISEYALADFPDEATFIRISVFTNEYIRVNTARLNQSLSLNPKVIFKKEKKGYKKFLSRFSTQSNFQITRKVRESDVISPWNPLELDIADTSLVTVNALARNTLFFNRIHPKFGMEIGQTANQNRLVLLTGYEGRSRQEQFVRMRWNINSVWGTECRFSYGDRANDSENFNEKDFDASFQKVEPQLRFTPTNFFRMVVKYQYQDMSNQIGNRERVFMNDISTELTFNQLSETSLRGKFSFIKIDLLNGGNAFVEQALLQGLKNGQNFLWNLTLDRRLTNNIQLTVAYEGRKTGEARIVHVGRAQVRATF